jgi:hypothetical protein
MSSSDETESERLFEQACAAARIQYRRIKVATVPGYRRPDYKVRASECGAIVEVKEIGLNDQDRERRAELEEGRGYAWQLTPGARLRPLIKNANSQLQRASRLGVPTIVAMFDATGSFSYTDPYNVKTAMFGLDAVVLALPEDPKNEPYFLRMKRGGKATLTEEHNTSTSAIAIIRTHPERSGPMLLMYHNHFARVPIDPENLRNCPISQYQLGQAENGMTDWIEIQMQVGEGRT